MARHALITLVDDIDGADAAETVRFGLDGAKYEIDLSDAHAAELRGTLTAYVDAARPASRSGGSGRRSASSAAAAGETVAQRRARVQAMREWAQANGYDVASRGRIPDEVQAAYKRDRDASGVVANAISSARQRVADSDNADSDATVVSFSGRRRKAAPKPKPTPRRRADTTTRKRAQ